MEEFGGMKLPTTYESEPWIIFKNLINSERLKSTDKACVLGMACPDFPQPEEPVLEEKETEEKETEEKETEEKETKTTKKKSKCTKACGTGCSEEKEERDGPPELPYFCDKCLMGPENRELLEAFTLTKAYAILTM